MLRSSPLHSIARARRISLGVVGALASVASLVMAAESPVQAATPVTDMKVLVLSANGHEPAIEAWKAELTAQGVPFDLIVASTAAEITASTLAYGAGNGRYQAVVVANPDLISCDTDPCASTVSAAELAALKSYRTSFGIRQVDAYTYPSAAVGLSAPTSSGDLNGTVASLTSSGATAFPYLVGSVPIEYSYGYLANPAPAPGESFVSMVAASSGEPLVGVYQRSDATQEMVVTMDSNPSTLHARLLLPGMLRWVTKGAYLGYSRNNLSVQIDDVFLPDDRWDTVNNTTHEDDGATIPLIRMVESDVTRLQNWQSANGLKLDLAFNGAGSDEQVATYGSDKLTDALVGKASQFRWVNHTFSHPNLDLSTQEQIVSEINKNKQWASKKKIPLNAAELVTGEHSGLQNPAMPGALSTAKISWIASDNSRTPQQAKLGPALTVPRHPTNIYYNTATRQEQLDEYNYLYYENCTNTAVTTCLTSPATWDQYVNREAAIMLAHMLANDVKPHYVHQGNVAEDGVLYDVLDKVVSDYRKYVKVPLVQPTLSGAGAGLARQAAWADVVAGVKGRATISGTTISVTPSVDVQVPVTAGSGAQVRVKNAWGQWVWRSFGEVYGGARSGWTLVKAGTTLTINSGG